MFKLCHITDLYCVCIYCIPHAGWLVDVVIVLDRLFVFCDLELEPSQREMIFDPQPPPDYRTTCLVEVIKQHGKEIVVYRTLHGLYCGGQSAENDSSGEKG